MTARREIREGARAPLHRVGKAVGAVHVSGAARQWWLSAGGVAPCHRVGRCELVAVEVKPAGLDAEAMHANAAPGDRGHDGGDLASGLAAADRPQPDYGQRRKVDSLGGVQVGAREVVGESPALQDWDERQAGRDAAQFQVIGHGAGLVLAHR
jgi:hypothetical protein